MTTQEPKKKMSLLTKVLIGIGVLMAFGVIKNIIDPKTKPTNAETVATVPEEKKVDNAAEEAAKVEEIKKNTWDAAQLVAYYDENEVKADQDLKGKIVYVQGTIGDIKKDIGNDIYVILKTDDLLRQVQCYFDNEEIAAKLQKGQKVRFKGTCDGLMMNVQMKDCELLSF
jgi:hypothetical protein